MFDLIIKAFKDSLENVHHLHNHHYIPHIIPKPLDDVVHSIGFVSEMCDYLVTILPIPVWNSFEIILGLMVFILACFSRVYLDHFSSKSKEKWYIVKIGQLGLWLQGFAGIVAFVDGFINMIIDEHRISLSIIMLSIILVSISYLLSKKS